MTSHPTQPRTGNGQVEPVRGDEGAPILGPRNLPLELENPDLLVSPRTDSGTIPNLKFSYAMARNRVLSGGWAREITARELPVATELAGVNMRLKPGGIREMHWHKEAEWQYMIAGSARVTAVDEDGRNFIADIPTGGLWYFPGGIPHSIQGLQDGCEFLLVFDDGNFSENETFLITDWFRRTPRDVLAKNFGVPEDAFADIPLDVDVSRYVFAGTVPPPLSEDAVESLHSAPTASASSPPPATVRRGCGMPRAAPRSPHSRVIHALSSTPRSAPTASEWLPRPGTVRRGCGGCGRCCPTIPRPMPRLARCAL
jgi:oxalate decarboxylase